MIIKIIFTYCYIKNYKIIKITEIYTMYHEIVTMIYQIISTI